MLFHFHNTGTAIAGAVVLAFWLPILTLAQEPNAGAASVSESTATPGKKSDKDQAEPEQPPGEKPAAPAEAETEAAGDEATPPAEDAEADPNVISLTGFTIDRKTLEVRMDATVCLEQGILEYVVCLPETFEHEAVFVTKARPELLHAALLLVGLTPQPMPAGLEELWWDRALKRTESRVSIDVEWEFGGQTERAPLASMLRNRTADEFDPYDPYYGEQNAAAEQTQEEVEDAWVFAGSFFFTDRKTGKKIYAANAGGVLVGIWPNPSAVIQYGKRSGNPYRGAGLGMEVNEEMVPKEGTKVKLVFFKHKPDKDRPPDTPPPKTPPNDDPTP